MELNDNEDVATVIRRAFPARLEPDLLTVARLLPNAHVIRPSPHDFNVSVEGEDICIPKHFTNYDSARTKAYSFYATNRKKSVEATIKEFSELSIAEQPWIILACLMSRHFDGFVRESFAHHIAGIGESWTVPYVLALVGERVSPVIEAMVPHIRAGHSATYAEFARDNSKFVDLTRQRVLSHWLNLYRHAFPSLRQYPGFQVLDTVGLWRRRYARRLLAK